MSFAYLFQVFIVLVLICVLLYGILYVIRLLPGGKRFSNERLKRIEYLPLEYQVGVYLVAVDDQEFLVGVGNKKVNSIHPIYGKID